ncbi:MAG: hypothetical protein C5S41_10650 [Candidatus Methanomarinus sp.]|nr:MAG: hypothetical protein C5S41_10650 [ANME-2 cluster archaeon]
MVLSDNFNIDVTTGIGSYISGSDIKDQRIPINWDIYILKINSKSIYK